MKLALEAPPLHTLAIAGRDERFPVNRVFCVGRNYAAHAREMGKDPNYHHEIELVVAIGRGGRDIPIAQALEHVYGYAVGLDMTRRDLQLDARDKGRPWEFGKSFALSAPVGALSRAEDIGHPSAAAISLTVNGQPRQSSDIAKLIWSVSECVATLSEYEALEPGDIIMTGTPEGVNAVVAGDVMRGQVQGLGAIEVRITG
jgi:fumarylpyruvate hydrolase